MQRRGDDSISAVIAKYSKQGELEWIKEVETEDISHWNVGRLYGILKLKDGSYVIQGEKVYINIHLSLNWKVNMNSIKNREL